MSTTFREFLRQKAEGSDWGIRNQSRGEWIGALNRFYEQVDQWLREADPEGLLEIVRYEVERAEERLGIYDAPALKIRLGTEAVDVVPVGRYAIGPFPSQALQGLGGAGSPAAGRVDFTNEERKFPVFRGIDDGQDRWYVLNEQSQVTAFDRARLEAILQDLLS